ncbi:hypothetical protein [Clostridium akagii]|uniref:hypothetical protein n=1 Tax=Clostridium akagii TaxID=91623 RepID=UPI00047DBC88|nr:hypothetical protein [Clostridium akagii]
MEKICVLDSTKKCNECGTCDKCDLNPEKICDSCGECINLELGEKKEILIDKILEDPDEIKEYEEGFSDDESGLDENLLDDYDDDYVRDEKDDLPYDLQLIDDIDGLSEMIDEDRKAKQLLEEKSPGFFVVKKPK